MGKQIAIHWFRQDFRIQDNPALYHASKYYWILPIYIIDETYENLYPIGEASKWWLYQSLQSLNKTLQNNLIVYIGDTFTILHSLIQKYNLQAIYCNRGYEPHRRRIDQEVKTQLEKIKIPFYTDNSTLLWEPWEVLKQDNTPYMIFTPFYRKGCLQVTPPRRPVARLNIEDIYTEHSEQSQLERTDYFQKHGWHKKLEGKWKAGEEAAQKQLERFVANGIRDYKKGRDFPACEYVSKLSPYLHFGEISPHQVWHYIKKNCKADQNVEHFCSELGWREFSYYLLYHFPNLPNQNLQKKFNHFPWVENSEALVKWQKGLTGYPIIDAGMRELWLTGYMHNRVRMIVGSFLVKNLGIHWKQGERWFWNCLVDADLANNSASWQWVAGSGADAAPYFRIFNPITQAEKFDPEGKYIKRYLPILKKLPVPFLFNPSEASREVLKSAGIFLGENYPMVMIDLKASRECALANFATIKNV